MNSPSIYQFPQETGVELRIYANSPFMTYNGQFIPAGHPNTPNSWYLPVACEIQGGNIFYRPSFEIDSTEDSPTDRSATYTAWLFANGERLGNVPFLAGFGVPALIDPLTLLAANQTWTSLILHRDAKNPPPRQGVYDIGQVEYLITQALGLLRMGSKDEVGNVALTTDPVDPQFPIAVSDTDPRLLVATEFILGRLRLSVPPVNPNDPIAVGDNDPRLTGTEALQGTGTLVAGVATTILEPTTTVNSPILAISMSDGISGNLRVSNRVAGVSFDVSSDNGADAGDFRWFLY